MSNVDITSDELVCLSIKELQEWRKLEIHRAKPPEYSRSHWRKIGMIDHEINIREMK